MPRGAGKPPAEAPVGWTRYFDPGTEQTYLYCEATGDWHFEIDDKEPDKDRPNEPARRGRPAESAASSSAEVPAAINAGGQFASEDLEVMELAKQDEIVRDFIRDEMKLRKKLREIETLEALATEGRQWLEATQVAKISKKDSILSDLGTVKEQITEAMVEFKKSNVSANRPSPASAGSSVAANSRPSKTAQKGQRKNPAAKVPAVHPLPQRGKAPLPVNPNLAAQAGNSASRLAAWAPPVTVAVRPAAGYVAAEAPAQASANRNVVAFGEYVGLSSRAQPPPPSVAEATRQQPHQVPQKTLTVAATTRQQPPLVLQKKSADQNAGWPKAQPRPPPPPVPGFAASPMRACGAEEEEADDGGFVQVRRGAKGRQAALKASQGFAQAEDDDDSFW
eukprot:TRINITY_DN15916_c0_g2_i1.p1 TRINITY_DN15916_c0_g2~~TRINITY_DN15916_c0_g2_i1.p1  ORF type:complete len:393 (+),score=97.38 TRINITY_DN15916_c0_g2_i1:107-1285(+)